MSSKTIKSLIDTALVAKYYIKPVPKNLTQSTGICSYFQQLSEYPLIQYRHARDSKTATRLNSFRVIFKDPLPEASTSTSTLVKQLPFHQRYDEAFRQSNKSNTPVSDILKNIRTYELATNIDEERTTPSNSIYLSSYDHPTTLESALLGTSQIILENSTNRVVSYQEFTQIPDSQHENFTVFNLNLAMLSRDPKVIQYASTMSLLSQYTNIREVATGNMQKTLESIRSSKLHGFNGDLKVE